MKKILKNISLFLLIAVMLVASAATGALAAGPGEITVNKTVAGKTYDIYRIFDVTYTGTGANKTYLYTMTDEFKGFFTSEYGIAADDHAGAVAIVSDSKKFDAFVEKVKKYALENGIAVTDSKTATGTSVVFSNLSLGYYLVYPQGGLTAACSLTTTDPEATVDVKTEYPEIDKVIVENGTDKDVTTSKVGDMVTFKLTSTVPDMTGYTKYTYKVTDTLSAGLTFNNDVAVKVGTRTLYSPQDFKVTPVAHAGNETIFEIDFVDFLQHQARAGDKVVITYTATVNENAVIGGTGNPNEVNLIYSNNPKDENSTDKTPDDIVIVYTFMLNLEKVDAANHATKLNGAIFSLWTPEFISGATTKSHTDGGSSIVLYLIKNDLETTGNGTFQFNVKAGTYYLFEETPPTGYNKMTDPIKFTVTPEFDPNTNLLLNVTTDNTDVTWDASTGSVSTTVENRSGLELPSTGGRGVTLFVAGGGVLMLGSIGTLIFRRKKSPSRQK